MAAPPALGGGPPVPPPPAAATVAAAVAIRSAQPQSPPFVVGGGYWARFGWLPPENIAYLQEAMAAEDAASAPGPLPEHAVSWLEGGEDEGEDDVVDDPCLMEAMLREYLQRTPAFLPKTNT